MANETKVKKWNLNAFKRFLIDNFNQEELADCIIEYMQPSDIKEIMNDYGYRESDYSASTKKSKMKKSAGLDRIWQDWMNVSDEEAEAITDVFDEYGLDFDNVGGLIQLASDKVDGKRASTKKAIPIYDDHEIICPYCGEVARPSRDPAGAYVAYCNNCDRPLEEDELAFGDDIGLSAKKSKIEKDEDSERARYILWELGVSDDTKAFLSTGDDDRMCVEVPMDAITIERNLDCYEHKINGNLVSIYLDKSTKKSVPKIDMSFESNVNKMRQCNYDRTGNINSVIKEKR